MNSSSQKIFLGIDTGGTYTDAVLFDPDKGVLTKAKSLTTKSDLAIGISGAVDGALNAFEGDVSSIALVSMSTTLATNALVEGKGGSVGLVMIGFEEADIDKAGLRESLGTDPVIFIPGGHDVQGKEKPLDMSGLGDFLNTHKDNITGFAVAGYFAVRNASHEIEVSEYLHAETGLPTTCSHELSSKLGGPKRAVTTLLNARLIPVIQDLILACRQHIGSTGINAPLMVVRGDGALVDADFALKRPIETILSGPAASLVGAKYLLGTQDAVVSDIGGTTTDVAILDKGWPRIEPNGASVGGFITMVEAVAMHTYGLGGDSVVQLDEEQATKINLGPRRQIPISLLAMEFPDLVLGHLKRQRAIDSPTTNCVRFAMKIKGSEAHVNGLKSTEQSLFQRLTDEPQALDQLLKGSMEIGTLSQLVSRGFAQVSGFTPSDAMHVLGEQDNWDGEAAKLAASIICKFKDKFGNPIAPSVEVLCSTIKLQLTKQSVDVIIKTCMAENDIDIGPAASKLIDHALEKRDSFVKLSLELDRPLVGLGASAKCYYPAIGERLNTKCEIPEHADVANAIGAVTSEVRLLRSVTITSRDGGGTFEMLTHNAPQMFVSEDEAMTKAQADLRAELETMAQEAGADQPVFETSIVIEAPEIEGGRYFVSAEITMSATGKPKLPNAM